MLNEMPDDCNKCPCFDGMEGRSECNALCEDVDGKPNNCPLIEINDNIAKLIEVAR